VLVLE